MKKETASASQQLSTQADFLMNLMNNFRLNGEAQLTSASKTPITPPKPEPAAVKHPQVTTKINSVQLPLESGIKRKIVLDDGEFGKY